MNILTSISLESVENISMLYGLGLFLIISLPVIITLLIARFRGFWASLFCLPTLTGIVSIIFTLKNTESFIVSLKNSSNALSKGIYGGLEITSGWFLGFHNSIWFGILNALSLKETDALYKVFASQYWKAVPYAVIFLVLFIFVHKRKRKIAD